MSNIRISGFDNNNELQEHLLELVPDARTEEPVVKDDAEVRAAELELAWLRKEVAELQEQFSRMGRQTVAPQPVRFGIPLWLKITFAAVASCAVGKLMRQI